MLTLLLQVMLTASGHVRLSDMGLAVRLMPGERLRHRRLVLRPASASDLSKMFCILTVLLRSPLLPMSPLTTLLLPVGQRATGPQKWHAKGIRKLLFCFVQDKQMGDLGVRRYMPLPLFAALASVLGLLLFCGANTT